MAKKRNKRQSRATPILLDKVVRAESGFIARDVNDKYSEYPSSGLNPLRLANIFKEADVGNVRRQMELFEEMEEKDTHLFSQLQTRKLAITGLDWDIQEFSGDSKDIDIAEFVKEQLKALENIDDIFTDILDCIGKGISISEIEWGISTEGYNVIKSIEWVHPKKLVWDSTTDEMLICTKEYPNGIKIPENKFIVHKYKAKSGHPSRAGILRIIAWMYVFKNYDVKDWVAFLEVFGMPLRLGKYDASASDMDRRALKEALVSLGSDGAGIIPSTAAIEFIESNKTSSADVYESFARYCDEQISKAVLGQTLTADSGGSYAQSKTHGEVRQDLTEADAKALASTIRRYIIKPLVEFNFGTGCNIPHFQFAFADTDDLKTVVDIYKTLSVDMGVAIPTSHIYKKFNIPQPEKGEDICTLGQIKAIEEQKDEQKIVETEQKALTLKVEQNIENMEQIKVQSIVDNVVSKTVEKSKKMFTGMLKPLMKIVEESDSLEMALETLKDKDKIKEVYADMESVELQDILKQAMYISNLLGRSIEVENG